MPGDPVDATADFTAYLAARWPSLVRTLVLLGLPQQVAEDACLTGLARCRAAWRQVRELDDVDVEVHRAVLDARPHGDVEPVSLPEPDDPTEAERLRVLLQRQLARLTSEQREAIVLNRAAGLDRPQVADVLDIALGTVDRRVADALAVLDPALRTEDAVRTAAASIDVPPPPYDEVVARVRAKRRRRWQVGLAVAVVVAVVVAVGVGVWASSRPSTPQAPPLHVVAERNPVGSAWYADGRLHLQTVSVDLPGVTDAAAFGASVVYLDQDGRVGIVDSTGARVVVGSAVPGSSVLGSAGDGWAVWLHPDNAGLRIVVWSTNTDEVVETLAVSPETRLVAIDQSRIYAQSDSGAFVWAPSYPEAGTARISTAPLLAIASEITVFQRGRRIEIGRAYSGAPLVPGEGAIISRSAAYVLTSEPGRSAPGAPYPPLLYDVRDGSPLPTGIAADERVVDAAFGDGGDLDYFVVKAAEGDVGTLVVLRECDPSSGRRTMECHDVAPVRTEDGVAFFAH